MVSRNDLCPCGSGKKYKKCCITKQKAIETVEVLHGVLQQFFHAHPTQKEMVDLYRWLDGKEEALAERYDNERLSTILGDAYFFTYKVDIWIEFLVKQIQSGTLSAEIKETLKIWKKPLRIFGQVIKIENEEAIIKDLLMEGNFTVPINESFSANQNDYVLSHFVPVDPTDTKWMPLNGVLTLNHTFTHVEREIKQLANSYHDIEDFWLNSIVEAYYIFGVKQKLEDREISDKEQQVLFAVYNGMIEMEVKSDELMAMLIAYMHKHNVVNNIKKPESLAAGVIQYGLTEGYFDSEWTKKRICEYYQVSATNASAHEKNFAQFIEEEWEDVDDSQFKGMAFEVGTDARPSEFTNWQLYMHLKEHEITSENEMKRYIEAYINVPYEPKNEEEKAQFYVYDAYFADDQRLKDNCIEIAHLLDSENVDVLLWNAEKRDDRSLFEKAINKGQALFDTSSDVPWQVVTNRPYLRALFKYGMWLFDEDRFDEAFTYLNQILLLNPGDHQGVRYPTVACLIGLKRYDEANKLMEHYQESDNAFFSWFRWAISRKQNFFSGETQELYELAMMDNGYVSKFIRDKSEALPFPGYKVITPDSPEEARVIWNLLSKII